MTDNPSDTALSQAVTNGDWNRARHLAAIRVAQMMEKTESPRETKALAISLADLINQCEATDATDAYSDTPLAQILEEANAQK